MVSDCHTENTHLWKANWVVLRQCAWCGALHIGGRFRFHHRLPPLTWALHPRLFSWLSLTVGLTHGACPFCAETLVRQGQTLKGTSPIEGMDHAADAVASGSPNRGYRLGMAQDLVAPDP